MFFFHFPFTPSFASCLLKKLLMHFSVIGGDCLDNWVRTLLELFKKPFLSPAPLEHAGAAEKTLIFVKLQNRDIFVDFLSL
jgi:hypothetical protein